VAPDAAVCGAVGELCAREDVDWVFIGSFNSHHAAQTIVALSAGKNVFCEKPLSLSLDEAEEMHEAWKSSGRIFALGLVLRYSPLYRMARKFLEEGRIGEILSFEFNETLDFNHGGYIHGNWRRHRELAGTHLLEKCCHDIDLALWLTGSLPTRVASFGGRSFFKPENARHVARIGNSPNGATAYRAWPDPHGVDPFCDDKSIVDHQVAILDFASGIKGTFHTQCNAGIPERRFYFCGTEGSMRFDAYTGELEVGRIGWEKVISCHKPIAGSGHAGGDELMARELAEVLAESRAPAAGFTEGIRSLVVANAVDEAMEKGVVVDMRPQWKRVASVFGGDEVLDRAY
jgi:predicted dehydrogenase